MPVSPFLNSDNLSHKLVSLLDLWLEDGGIIDSFNLMDNVFEFGEESGNSDDELDLKLELSPLRSVAK